MFILVLLNFLIKRTFFPNTTTETQGAGKRSSSTTLISTQRALELPRKKINDSVKDQRRMDISSDVCNDFYYYYIVIFNCDYFILFKLLYT